MIKRIKLILIVVVLLAAVAAGLYFYFSTPKKTIDVSEGRVSRIEEMVRLCAVDIYSEVPVLDTIDNKVMFAVQKQKGSVSFDIENMQVDAGGDTVRVTLPPEIIDLYEATEDNSWEVIDTKAVGPMAMLRSDKFTVEEENAVKANIKRNSRRLLYRNGTVKRARADGAQMLRTLLETVYDRPVMVTDPTPDGAHFNEYR